MTRAHIAYLSIAQIQRMNVATQEKFCLEITPPHFPMLEKHELLKKKNGVK